MKPIKIRDLFNNPPSRGDAEYYPAAEVEALVAAARRMLGSTERYFSERSVSEAEMYLPSYRNPYAELRDALKPFE